MHRTDASGFIHQCTTKKSKNHAVPMTSTYAGLYAIQGFDFE
jgi:hypothetical protein